MKSFADWTQELAESQNHEPEPKRDRPKYGEFADGDGAEECEYCSGTGVTGQTYSSPCGEPCGPCGGTGRVWEVCCGCGRDKYGPPNTDDGRYYCNAVPPYNCQP